MAKIFTGENPSQLYMDALLSLLADGERYSPRGKEILELRPVIFEYTNPLNRVTFLKGRVINPFFQLAESWWILDGRADVGWLSQYNKSIAQFSDDGKWFNAPYGERLRKWGANAASGVDRYGSTLDQLLDCYKKLKADPDTRQAVSFIGNPDFDGSHYTLQNGKDIACNLNIKFKIRDGKLHISVDNRSNDLHWGVFGANLCQFATIQETVASWVGVEVGTYCQVTDSLHIYTNNYGAAETEKVLDSYGGHIDVSGCRWNNVDVPQFIFESEPRMNSGYSQFLGLQQEFNQFIDPVLSAPHTYSSESHWGLLMDSIDDVKDDYWRMTFYAMAAYQAYKAGQYSPMLAFLESMPDSQWKVSCLRFLSKKCGKLPSFRQLYKHLDQEIISYIDREGE